MAPFQVLGHQFQNRFGLIVLGQLAQALGKGSIAGIQGFDGIGTPADVMHIAHQGQFVERAYFARGRNDELGGLGAIRLEYEAAWRRNFSRRVHVAALFAHLFMRPVSAMSIV